MGIFLTSSGLAAVASMGWLLVIESYGAQLIQGILAAVGGLLGALAVVSFSSMRADGIMPGIMFTVLCIYWCLYYQQIKSRIPFTAVNLRISCHIARSFPNTIRLAVAAVVLQLLWVLLWSAAMLGVRGMIDGYADDISAGATLSTLVMFIRYTDSDIRSI